MNFYLSLPILFLKFYFVEFPLSCAKYFLSFNSSFLQVVSLPLLIRTFFLPWKNEYRLRFIPVAVGIGMSIKACVIIADVVLFAMLLGIQIAIIVLLALWPILTVMILFK